MYSRRDFIRQAALLSGGLGALAATPASILRAMAIEPAPGTTFLDAEHVVILMQENRSFDHAYGALRGVRGFDDPRVSSAPGGNPVWLQTDAQGKTFSSFPLDIHGSKSTWTSCLPHGRGDQVAAGNGGKHDRWLTAKKPGIKEYALLPLTLGYYDRRDIPFYYALADAFTICDQHFCSACTCTTPNRIFLWTGTNRDPRDPKAVARLNNDQIDHDTHASWPTFPERLEDLGVSWKIYQNEIDIATGFRGEEDRWLANYGDNPMEYFEQYHADFHPAHIAFLKSRRAALAADIKAAEAAKTLAPKAKAKLDENKKSLAALEVKLARLTPENFARLPARERSLHAKAFTINSGDPDFRKLVEHKYADGATERTLLIPAGDVFHQFRKDVDTGKLPAVSWLVAPENFSDHPSAAWYGAWYVSEALDILTKNPEVWKKTVFILTYDENDGYYDHIPPFTPPKTGAPGTGAASEGLNTTLEFDERGRPIGLGYRVPMVIASPWSRGGHVCSQVFDHTSVLRFLEVFVEKRTGKSIRETNISEWRRTISGDLTSAFGEANSGKNPEAVARDPFVEGIHKAQFLGAPSGFRDFDAAQIEAIRKDPAGSGLLTRQEPGFRPSRALPYELQAEGRLNATKTAFEIGFVAEKRLSPKRPAGAPFRVYAPGNYIRADGRSGFEACRQWSFAVKAGDKVGYAWPLADFENGRYALRTSGPNGFFREYAGDASDPAVDIRFAHVLRGRGADEKPSGEIEIRLVNRDTAKPATVTIADQSYGAGPVIKTLKPGETTAVRLSLEESFRWYDLAVTLAGAEGFLRRYAGRVETGASGRSDPAIGRSRPA